MIKIYNNYKHKQIKGIYYYEDELQASTEKLLFYLLMNKGFYYHPQEKEGGTKGLPDILGWYKNGNGFQPFFIELKTMNKKATMQQEKKMMELLSTGCIGAICYSFEDVKDFLKQDLKINIQE